MDALQVNFDAQPAERPSPDRHAGPLIAYPQKSSAAIRPQMSEARQRTLDFEDRGRREQGARIPA
jgi:hypothetical protein